MTKRFKGPDPGAAQILAAGAAIVAGLFAKHASEQVFGTNGKRHGKSSRAKSGAGGGEQRQYTDHIAQRAEAVIAGRKAQDKLRAAAARMRIEEEAFEQLYATEERLIGGAPLWLHGALHDIAFTDRAAIDPDRIDRQTGGARAAVWATFTDPTRNEHFRISKAQDVSNCGGTSSLDFAGRRFWYHVHDDPLLGRTLSIGPRALNLEEAHYRALADLLFAALRHESHLEEGRRLLQPFDTVALHSAGEKSDYDELIAQPPRFAATALALEAHRERCG
ncbi:hypothetical protein [Sphingomicrobium astaxanthinifaciens]|uniref:hypothetical protein n=1 Tax=Sphingomicrobium astaxanthinifaciens TaxID=1227949 RepID=UPI001FCB4268|nr:hypothetical protein [Sphingomicrobium astaxanthinifaciens]MCJ7422016.1 hypothetical protein [Sphingomicrobium astaxanthinifaciens]